MDKKKKEGKKSSHQNLCVSDCRGKVIWERCCRVQQAVNPHSVEQSKTLIHFFQRDSLTQRTTVSIHNCFVSTCTVGYGGKYNVIKIVFICTMIIANILQYLIMSKNV